MIMDIWVLVHQINSLQEVLILKQNFQKYWSSHWQNFVFVIGSFWTPHSICIKIGCWQGSSVWKCCVFNLSTFDWKAVTNPIFLKQVFVFQETYFNEYEPRYCKVRSLSSVSSCTDAFIWFTRLQQSSTSLNFFQLLANDDVKIIKHKESLLKHIQN